MSFEEIMFYIRKGEAVKRDKWGRGMYLVIMPPEFFSPFHVPCFILTNIRGQNVPYSLSADDILAKDWSVFNN